MDLVPKPGQVVAAAGNLAHMMLYGGLADLRPMPRTVIDEGEQREVYHYLSDAKTPQLGDPVLLVSPLAAPAACYDLRRGCSLVEHLVRGGRQTYLLEYGEVSFRDRDLGVEQWVEQVLPDAIEAVSRHAGGRPVHVVGWSLGGMFSLLAAADRPSLPIASLAALGTPFDVRRVPIVAPMRPLFTLTEGSGQLTRLYQALGGARLPLVRWALELSTVQKFLAKPLAMAVNLDDTEFLSQLEAVDRLVDQMEAYPGRTFGQLYHRFIRADGLASGRMQIGERVVDLADVTAPVLLFGGMTDGIAPIAAVRTGVPMLSGSPEVRFEMVPGGHLGMLTGRKARESTWLVIDEWLDQWSGSSTVTKATTRKAVGRKAPAKKAASSKKAPAKKTAAKKATSSKKATPSKTAAKKATARKTTAKRDPAKKTAERPIGSNPDRRYGSGGSRALSR